MARSCARSKMVVRQRISLFLRNIKMIFENEVTTVNQFVVMRELERFAYDHHLMLASSFEDYVQRRKPSRKRKFGSCIVLILHLAYICRWAKQVYQQEEVKYFLL